MQPTPIFLASPGQLKTIKAELHRVLPPAERNHKGYIKAVYRDLGLRGGPARLTERDAEAYIKRLHARADWRELIDAEVDAAWARL
jgi:hypothetical protein